MSGFNFKSFLLPLRNDSGLGSELRWFEDVYCKKYSVDREIQKSIENGTNREQESFWKYFYNNTSKYFIGILASNFILMVAIQTSSDKYHIPDLFRSAIAWEVLTLILMFYFISIRFSQTKMLENISMEVNDASIATGEKMGVLLLVHRILTAFLTFYNVRPFVKSSKSMSISLLILCLLLDCLQSCLFMTIMIPFKNFTHIYLVLCIFTHLSYSFSTTILSIEPDGFRWSSTFTLVAIIFDLVIYFATQLFFQSELRSYASRIESYDAVEFLREIVDLLSTDVKLPLQSMLNLISMEELGNFLENSYSTSSRLKVVESIDKIGINMQLITLLSDDLMILTKVQQCRANFSTGKPMEIHLPHLMDSILSSLDKISKKYAPYAEISYNFSQISRNTIVANLEPIEIILKNLYIFIFQICAARQNSAAQQTDSFNGPHSSPSQSYPSTGHRPRIRISAAFAHTLKESFLRRQTENIFDSNFSDSTQTLEFTARCSSSSLGLFKGIVPTEHATLLVCARVIENCGGLIHISEQGDEIILSYTQSRPMDMEISDSSQAISDTNTTSTTSGPMSSSVAMTSSDDDTDEDSPQSNKSKWRGGKSQCKICILSDDYNDQNFILAIFAKIEISKNAIVSVLSSDGLESPDSVGIKLQDMTDVAVVSSDKMLIKLRNANYDGYIIFFTGSSAYLSREVVDMCDLIVPIPCYEVDEKRLNAWLDSPKKDKSIANDASRGKLIFQSSQWLPWLAFDFSWMWKFLKFGIERSKLHALFRSDFNLPMIRFLILREFAAFKLNRMWAWTAAEPSLRVKQQANDDLGKKFDFQYSILGVSMFTSDIEESLCKWRILSPTRSPMHSTSFINFSGFLLIIVGLSSAQLGRSTTRWWKTALFGLIFLARGVFIRRLFMGRARIFWIIALAASCYSFINTAMEAYDTFASLDCEVESFETIRAQKFGHGQYTGTMLMDLVAGSIVVGWGFYFPWPFAILLPLSGALQLFVIFFVAIIRFIPKNHRLFFVCYLSMFLLLQLATLVFYEQRHRTEFQLLRKNNFSITFLEELFALFAKEIFDPIGEILALNKELFQELSKQIVNYPRGKISPSLIHQIAQFSKGHVLLQELYYEHELKQNTGELLRTKRGVRSADINATQRAKTVCNVSKKLQHLARFFNSVDDFIPINLVIEICPTINLVVCDEKVLTVCVSNALNRAFEATKRFGALRLSMGLGNRAYSISLLVKPHKMKTRLKFNDDRLMLVEVYSSALMDSDEMEAITVPKNTTAQTVTSEGSKLFNNSFGDWICRGIVLDLHEDAIFESVPVDKIPSRTDSDAAPNDWITSSNFLMQRFTVPYVHHHER